MSSGTESRSADQSSGAQTALWIAAGLLLVPMFWWMGRWMYIRWTATNSYYSHGFLIPLVSLGKLWWRRDKLAACSRRPCGWGVPFVMAGLLMHLLASGMKVGFASGFAFLFVLGGLTLTLFGPQLTRLAAFPIGYLVFMVPLPFDFVEKLSFNLKLLSAGAATGVSVVAGLGVAPGHQHKRICTV